MKYFRAEAIDELDLHVGLTVALESLRESVVPPYIFLMPFIEVPDCLEKQEYALGEDGVHGAIYHITAKHPCTGEIVVGFRDLMSKDGETIRTKTIRFSSHK